MSEFTPSSVIDAPPPPAQHERVMLEQRMEQNFQSFGKAQELIQNRLLGTETNPVFPDDVAQMTDRESRLQFSRDIATALEKHSTHSIAEKVQRGVNEYIQSEVKLDKWWNSEEKKTLGEDHVKEKLVSALTANMKDPPTIAEIPFEEITIERMHGGIALRVSPEIFAKIVQPHIMEGKLDGETDEQAFIRIQRQAHMTVARLLKSSEINAEQLQQLGLDANTKIAIGFGDFVEHEEKEILYEYIDKGIKEDPAIQRYRERYKGIPGSTDEQIMIALHDLANRIDEEKRNITVGTLGITPDYATTSLETAISTKMVATIADMAQQLLKKYPDMRQQLSYEVNGSCIQPEELVNIWYMRLHPDEATPSVEDIVLASPDLTPKDFQEAPGTIMTFGREGRSIFDGKTLIIGKDMPVALSDGSTIRVLQKLGSGGYSIVFKGRINGTNNEVAIKEAFFPDREAKIDKIRTNSSAEAYWKEVLQTIAPGGDHVAKANAIVRRVLHDMKPTNAKYPSLIYDTFIDYLNAETNKLSLPNIIQGANVHMAKFTDGQKQLVLDALHATLLDLSTDAEDTRIDPRTHQMNDIAEHIKEFDDNRKNVEQQSALFQRINDLHSPYFPHHYEIVNGPDSQADIDKPEYKALWYIEEFLPGENLENISKHGLYNTVFPDLDSKNECVRQLMEAIKQLQSIPPHGIVHSDLKPENIMIEVHDSGPSKGKFKQVRITDFGISKVIEKPHKNATQNFGTPAYAAPEQASRTEHRDLTTDEYSLGILMYKLYTNEDPPTPPNRLTDVSTMLANLAKHTPPIPNEIQDIMRRMTLRKRILKHGEDPLTARYQNADEMYAAFDAYLNKPAAFPNNGTFTQKLDYLTLHEPQPQNPGVISLREFRTPPIFTDIINTLNEIENELQQPGTTYADVTRAFTNLERFAGNAWSPELAKVVKLETAETMRKILEYTATDTSLWEKNRITQLARIVENFDDTHPDTRNQTLLYIHMFKEIVDTDHSLIEDALDELRGVTMDSDSWTNTSFKESPQEIATVVHEVLRVSMGMASKRTYDLGMDVINELPNIGSRDADRATATDTFIGNFYTLARSRQDIVMDIFADLAADTKWTQNEYLHHLTTTTAIDQVLDIIQMPGRNVQPEWMRTAARLATKKMTRANATDQRTAVAIAKTAIQSMEGRLQPGQIDRSITILNDITRDPSLNHEFYQAWGVDMMRGIIDRNISYITDTQIRQIIDATVNFRGVTSDEPRITQSVITLLRHAYNDDSDNSKHILNALHRSINTNTIPNTNMFTSELASVMYDSMNNEIRYSLSNPGVDRWTTPYRIIIENIGQPPTPESRSETNHFMDTLKLIKDENFMSGADLVQIFDDMYNTPPRNALLNPPAVSLFRGLRGVMESAAHQGEFQRAWIELSRNILDDMHTLSSTDQDQLAQEFLAMSTRIARELPPATKDILNELAGITSGTWRSDALGNLKSNPELLASEALDILGASTQSDWDIDNLKNVRDILAQVDPKHNVLVVDFYDIMKSGVLSEPYQDVQFDKARDVMDVFKTNIHPGQIFRNTLLRGIDANRIAFVSDILTEVAPKLNIPPFTQQDRDAISDTTDWNNTLLTIVEDNFAGINQTETIDTLKNYVTILSSNTALSPLLTDVIDKISASKHARLKDILAGLPPSILLNMNRNRIANAAASGTAITPTQMTNLASQIRALTGPDAQRETQATISVLQNVSRRDPAAAATALTSMLEVANTANPVLMTNTRDRMQIAEGATHVVASAARNKEYDSNWLPTVTENMSELLRSNFIPVPQRISAARSYLQSISDTLGAHPDKREEIIQSLRIFSRDCLYTIRSMDPSLETTFNSLINSLRSTHF